MRSEWEKTTLGSLCEISSSKRIYAKEYCENGIAFYRGKEIIEKSHGSDISTELYISLDRYKELKSKFGAPVEGDILLTAVGTLGVPYLVKQEEFYFKDGNLVWFRNFNCALPKYVFLWLQSPEGQKQIEINSIGSTQRAITIDALKKFNIILPPVYEQKAIVAVLSALDDKIELNNRINQKLEEMAQAIFKSWFVDFEPFQYGEFVESELGLIPKGWSVKSLSECCSMITRGITPKYDEDSNQIIINQKCIRGHEVNLAPARRHKPKAITDKWLKYGDVLVNSTGQGTLGRTAQWFGTQQNITVDSHVTIVRPVDSSLVCFLGQLIMSREIEIENMASGSTGQTELSRERLGSLCIVVPDTVSLQKFSAIVQPLMNAAIYRNEETIRLSKIRDILLPKLISGDIPVQVGTD